MLKRAAVIFGIVFVVVGFLGFIPGVTTYAPDVQHARLLGVFAVDTMHNMMHVLTGAVAIWMGLTGQFASRNYFRACGIFYAVLAFLGYGYGDAPLFGMMADNLADAALNTMIALMALFLGFGRVVGSPGTRHTA